jgi:hypothetical protein
MFHFVIVFDSMRFIWFDNLFSGKITAYYHQINLLIISFDFAIISKQTLI